MRATRALLFVLVLAAACGGNDAPPAGPAAPAEPQFEGKSISAWCAELEAPSTCRVAALTLARLRMEPRALPALLKALSNASDEIRKAASAGLAAVGESTVGPVAALLDAPDQATRDAAGDTLARIAPAGLRRLVVALGDPAARVSATASAALQRAGDAAVGPLADGLTLGNAATRGPAAKCLAALKAAPALASALGDASTRDLAVETLVSMGPDAVPALQDAASDPRRQTAANEALARIRSSGTTEAVRLLANPATRAKAAADLAAKGDLALPAILAGLAGDSDPVRDACADLLAPRAATCVEQVKPLLADARPATRTAAARLLLKAGAPGVAPLVEALGDADAAVRDSIAAALRDGGAPATAVLVAALEHGSDAARSTAAKALAALGAPAVPAVADVASRGDAAARTAAFATLVEIGAPSASAVARLLASPDEDLRFAAADALGRLGAAGVPELMKALAAKDGATAAAAGRGLASAGASAVAALVSAIQSADATLAARSAAALDAVGATALPELTKLVGSPSVEARTAVVRAIGVVAKDVDAAVPPLVAALADAEAAVRVEAAHGLALAGPRAKSATKALETALRDKSPLVRVEAASALIRAGGNAASALPYLTNGLQDKDDAVRLAAVESLARSGLPKAQLTPPLLAALKDSDVDVRLAAIAGLVAAGATGDAVADALAKCAQSTDTGERAAALAALPKVSNVSPADAMHVGGPFRGDRVRRKQLAALGGTKQTESAVAAALDWLARHQSPTGEWAADFSPQCRKEGGPACFGTSQFWQHAPGLTGLALLAFLGAGEGTDAGAYKDVVFRGLDHLRGVQDSQGCFGLRESNHFMYDQGVATVALCDAYMITGDPSVRDSASRGLAFILQAKNPYLAWRYAFPPDGDNDTSVTGWMSYAVAEGAAAGLLPDKAPVRDAVSWVEKMTELEFGRTGYQQRGGPPSRSEDMMEKFPADQSESLTSIGVMIRLFAGHTPKDDEFIMKGADLLVKKAPRWDLDRGCIDFYYWFWGTTAMRQAGGDHWKRWNEALKTALVGSQHAAKARCDFGSWDPVDPWSAIGGRVYSTSMCCLCLESYYRMDSLPPGK